MSEYLQLAAVMVLFVAILSCSYWVRVVLARLAGQGPEGAAVREGAPD